MMPGVKAAAGQDLTPREREVLAGFLAGRSEKQIAVGLGLSRHSVHNHAKALYLKLDVNSRGELLALFIHTDADLIQWVLERRREVLTQPQA